MSYQLVGKKYRDMPDEYRQNTSRKEFRGARKKQRMAGEALAGDKILEDKPLAEETPQATTLAVGEEGGGGNTPVEEVQAPGFQQPDMNPETDDISTYDVTAGGAGSNKGTSRLSRADLRHLKDQGYSYQQIVDYSEKMTADGSVKQGKKAQDLLARYKNKIGTEIEPTPTPEPTPEPDPTPAPEPTPGPTPEPSPITTQAVGEEGGGGPFPPMPAPPIFQFPPMPSPIGPGGPGGPVNNNTFIDNSNEQINNSKNTIGDGSSGNYINNGQYNYGGHSMINNLTF